MWNTAFETTIKSYEAIRGEIIILIFGFLGGLLGMACNYFGLNWNDNLLFALFTIIFAILSFPLLLISNYLKLAISSVRIVIAESELDSKSIKSIQLTNKSGYDYTDVHAEIVNFDGILDPRYNPPNYPVEMNLFSQKGKRVTRESVWENHSIFELQTANNNIAKGNFVFMGREPIYFLGSGTATILVKGKKPNGKRDVKTIKATVSVKNNELPKLSIKL